MIHVIGIDPGLKGGVALVQLGDGRLVILKAERLPILKQTGGPIGRSSTMDLVKLEDILIKMMDRAHGDFSLVIEMQESRQKQAGSFTTAFNYGMLVTVVLRDMNDLQIRNNIFYAKANQWKPDLGLNSDKNRSLDVATRVFGRQAKDLFWPARSDEGVAEAALLAYWRARRLRMMMEG